MSRTRKRKRASLNRNFIWYRRTCIRQTAIVVMCLWLTACSDVERASFISLDRSDKLLTKTITEDCEKSFNRLSSSSTLSRAPNLERVTPSYTAISIKTAAEAQVFTRLIGAPLDAVPVGLSVMLRGCSANSIPVPPVDRAISLLTGGSPTSFFYAPSYSRVNNRDFAEAFGAQSEMLVVAISTDDSRSLTFYSPRSRFFTKVGIESLTDTGRGYEFISQQGLPFPTLFKAAGYYVAWVFVPPASYGGVGTHGVDEMLPYLSNWLDSIEGR